MLKRLYEASAYEAGSLTGCYWPSTCPEEPALWPPLDGEAQVEFAVIGAGFTGLSAALRIAESGGDVAVFDLHRPGFGASGRNGGFCCIGGAKASEAQIAARFGEADLRAYLAAERAAIERVAERVDTLGLDVDRHSAGEVELAHSPKAFAELRARAPRMAAAYGARTRLIGASELAAEGMGGTGFHGALHVDLGFALNPRKYAVGLAHAVLAQGGTIYGDSPVLEIRPEGTGYLLRTARGQMRAKHLILATNGYSADNLPDWMASRYLPSQSSVMVTRPLTEAELSGQGWTTDLMSYDTRHLLHYFRLMPDRRMLFGMRGAVRWTDTALASIKERTRRHFDQMFPSWTGVEATHFWSGLLCLSRELVPFAGRIGSWQNAWAGFAYHGNGVAMGSWTGDQLARLALGQKTDLPQFFGRVPRRFELGPMRRAALPIAYAHYYLQDRI